MQLKIMTFNVQHFRNFNYPMEDRVDFDFFAKYVAEKNADIVGLNEVYNNGIEAQQRQAFKVAERAGYAYAYFAEATKIHGVNDYGNAMISKYPFQGSHTIVPDPRPEELNGEYAETRCILKAEFAFEGKKLTVFCCHFGLNDAEIRNAVQKVCSMADACDTPLVLMGDFNATPDSSILTPLYECFDSTDGFFGENGATFPSPAPEQKIDYIFTRDVKVLSAVVCRDVLSDHCAIVAEIEV